MQTDNADVFVKDVALEEIRKSILLDIICGLEFIFRTKKTLVIPVRFGFFSSGVVTTFQRDKLVNETRQPPSNQLFTIFKHPRTCLASLDYFLDEARLRFSHLLPRGITLCRHRTYRNKGGTSHFPIT